MPQKKWTDREILAKLRELHRAGEDLSYNQMARDRQAVLSAAAYHFGSYRDAVKAAGIDYARVLRRPRWSKEAITKAIKQAKRKGEDLNWSAVVKRRDELGRAAFAALQQRLFGNWEKALGAAGLDSAKVSRYRRWDRGSILAALRGRQSAGKTLNSGAVQREDSGLHAAALRKFGSYDKALASAGIKPGSVRRRSKPAGRRI